MRIATVLAVALLGTAGFAAAEHAQAAIRHYQLNIPRQGLDTALKDLAQQTGLQIGRFSGRIDGSVVVGPVKGDQTPAQALNILLNNTGLDYKIVNDTTISVYNPKDPLPTTSAASGDVNQSLLFAYTTGSGEPALSQSAGEGDRRVDEVRVAQAQVPNGAQVNDKNERKETQGAIPEIVVTGHYEFLSADTSGTTNLPIPIEKVPQSISLVSGDFIKAADLKTLGEIAEYTPGAINVGNPGNYRTIAKLRGFDAGQSVDGLNLTGISTYFEPDYAIYDRLEIVKGPSSVVYGVLSPGGLVNFVTKGATAQTHDYLYAQAGSWNSYRLEGQIAGALDTQGHVRGIGIAVQDQGNSFVHQLYHKTTSVYGGLNVDFGTSVTGYVHGGYERQAKPANDGIPTEADGSPPPVPRSFFIGSRNIGSTADIYHAEGDITWHATDMLELGIKGNYQTVTIGGGQAFAFGLQSNGDLGIGAQAWNSRGTNYGIGLSSIYRFDSLGLNNSFVSFGVLYQKSDSHSDYLANPTNFGSGTTNIFNGDAAIGQALNSLLAGPLVSYFDLRAKADTLTFSGQSFFQIIEPLTVLLGVSYSEPKQTEITNGSRQDSSGAGQTSYRAGVTYELLPKTYAYVSYSQSFIPSIGADINGTPFPPLTGEQYEAGIKYRSGNGRMLLTGALFQIREKNVSVFDKSVNGIDFFKPLGEVTHKGFEFQSLGQITHQWQINAGYAYLDPKITKDSDPATRGQIQLFLPKQTFSLYTTYTLDTGLLRGLSFGGGPRYVSSQRTSYDGSTKDLPGYTLVDATVSYAVDKWLLQLNGHNIFDKHYFINSYQTLFFGNVVGDPVNVALSVRREF